MRIKEFSIRWYGPLPDTGRLTLGSFSLLFGKNEAGKTLIIDALAKLLFQHGRQLFSGINRVDGDPDGYLIIEDDNCKEIKLPEKGDLTSITGLTPEECRNIFIVRNSDLSIALESEFYKNVTDRLTGLKTQEISCIKDQLAELGKLTKAKSTASLRDWAGEKLNTRKKLGQELVGEVKILEEKLKEEDFDRLEEALLNVRERISETNSEIETLEHARKREKYEKGREAYEAVIRTQQSLHELEVYCNEDGRLWEGCERDIKNWEKEETRLQMEVNAKKAVLEQKVKALSEKKLEIEVLDDRKKRIDNEIVPETIHYEIGVGKVKREERRSRFFTAAVIASAALLLVSVLGLILNPSPLFYGLFASFLVSTGVFGALRFSLTREQSQLDAVFERIRLAACKFELGGENIEDILSNIRKFNEEYSKRNSETEKADREASLLDNEIRRLTEMDIAALEKKIGEAVRKIQELVERSGVTTLREYNEKLQLKLSCEKSSDTQRGILKSHFGSKAEKLEENLSYWHEMIEALKEFEHKATDVFYDEKVVSQLKDDLGKFLDEEQGLEKTASEFYRQLTEIERRANEILQLEDNYVYCATAVDLVGITDKLSKFINGIETDKSNALTAISIFEKLEQQEEGRISELFGEGSPVSQHFCHVTDGVYRGVNFVLDDIKEVRVTLQDGTTLAADKLSGGAYDQLYLSIRLALGEKLLKGMKGFFILDDPLVKADRERLERQLNILRRIWEAGWQIIYFTAKDEVVQLLKSDIDERRISYVALQDIFV